MHLKRLYLRFFRRFKELDIKLTPGLTILEGENGQGKTTALESIYLLASGSSFRAHNIKELIQDGSSEFLVEAEYSKNEMDHSVSISYDGERRRIALSNHVQEKASLLLGNLLAVLSSPDDIDIIFGSPQRRRKELDIIIAQKIPGYAALLHRYERIVQQRNKLLKLRQLETISVWEEALVETGSIIMRHRESLLKEVSIRFQHEMSQLSNTWKKWVLEYAPSVSSPDLLMSTLQEKREQEVRMGCSLYGPHRDDLSFLYSDVPAKSRASLGEAKLSVFAFRLACWSLLRDDCETDPLLLIDDLESFLDLPKRKALFKRIESMEQVIVSMFNVHPELSRAASTHRF